MAAAFRSLRHRNARWFFAGLLVSNVGAWMQLTAMSLLVYRLTGRTTDLGIVVALQFLPMLLFGAWAGAIADRHDKRRMSVLTQSLLAAQAFVLAVVVLTDRVNLPVVYVLTAVLGLVSAFDNPARRGLVTELVEPHEIGNAVSLNTAVMTGSRVFGPALAGLLIGPLGPGPLFLANAVSFAAIIASLVLIDERARWPAPLAARGGRPVRDALRFLADRPRLMVPFVTFTVVATFGFNHNVALPKLADRSFGGDHWYGVLLAVISVGSFVGSLLTARLTIVTMRWYVATGAVLGVSGVLLAWAPNLPLAIVFSVPMGLGGAAFVTAMNAIAQQECPPEMRGRLLALTAVALLGSYPLGAPLTGWIGDLAGARWALAYGALVSLVAVVALAWWLVRTPHGSPRAATRSTLAS